MIFPTIFIVAFSCSLIQSRKSRVSPFSCVALYSLMSSRVVPNSITWIACQVLCVSLASTKNWYTFGDSKFKTSLAIGPWSEIFNDTFFELFRFYDVVRLLVAVVKYTLAISWKIFFWTSSFHLCLSVFTMTWWWQYFRLAIYTDFLYTVNAVSELFYFSVSLNYGISHFISPACAV